MDPFAMPLNWNLNQRPDRPFANPSLPQSRPIPLHLQRQGPTPYYQQQAPFYTQNDGMDPFAHQPLVITHGPLKVLCLRIWVWLGALLELCLFLVTRGMALLSGMAQFAVGLAGSLGERFGFGFGDGNGEEGQMGNGREAGRGGKMEWKTFLLILFFADQIVRWVLLPASSSAEGTGLGVGVNGSELELDLDLQPVYTLFVRSGREAIGNGKGWVLS